MPTVHQLSLRNHVFHSVVEYRCPLVQHVLLVDSILWQDALEHSPEPIFLLYRTGNVYLLHPAFEAVLRLLNDVQEETPEQLCPADPPAPAQPVHNLLFLLIVAYPALDVIKNTESLVNITGRSQFYRLSAKY